MQTTPNVARTIACNGVIYRTYPIIPYTQNDAYIELKRGILDAEDFGYVTQPNSNGYSRSFKETVFNKLVDNCLISQVWREANYHEELHTIKQTLLPILKDVFEKMGKKFDLGAYITSITYERLGGQVDAFIDEDTILVINKASTLQAYRELLLEDSYNALAVAQAKADLLLAITGRRQAYLVVACPQFDLLPFHITHYQPEPEITVEALKKAQALIKDGELELGYLILLLENKVGEEQRQLLKLSQTQMLSMYNRFRSRVHTALNSDDHFE